MSRADLWIAAARVGYVEVGVPFSERKLYTVKTPGVAHAGNYVARFTQWKRPDGRQESVQIVGLDPDQPLGGPLERGERNQRLLKEADNVIIDELYKDKLGVDRLNQVVEFAGRRARVVGFTKGIRSFTTSPYVFTSSKSAQGYASIPVDQTMFMLVALSSGANVEAVRTPSRRNCPTATSTPRASSAR